MNFNNIFGEIEKVDPEVYSRFDTRRKALRNFAGIGRKIAIAAIPMAIGSMFKKAYAGSKSTNEAVVDILNYALTLEYLEAEFYTKGLQSPLLIPAGAANRDITTISNHETAHVKFLKDTITTAFGAAKVAAKPNIDLTAKGTFADVLTNYSTYLAVAQTFEDTGVRAYKGRAAELVKGGAYLTAALNIHSVEARHASHVRQMRKAMGALVKPWITGKVTGIGTTAVNASYAGEDLTTQATIQIVNINGMGISVDAATEAFDEGLTKDAVLAIVGPFFI
ncbi:MAG: ferritin-like domain-containing protein [Chitinophagaceae bacterium]